MVEELCLDDLGTSTEARQESLVLLADPASDDDQVR
jgi:hypothetical protein